LDARLPLILTFEVEEEEEEEEVGGEEGDLPMPWFIL
jgi:hypothetical protein